MGVPISWTVLEPEISALEIGDKVESIRDWLAVSWKSYGVIEIGG